MPRSSKGARLYAKAAVSDSSGAIIEHATWVIRDGRTMRRTGIRVADRHRPPVEAEEALAAYITSRREAPRERHRDAASIWVADVIAIYLTDVAPNKARPSEIAGRCKRLLAFWGDKRLSDVTGRSCRAYAATRGGSGAARRELEDLRAAIGHHRAEGLCREIIEVVLPDRGEARDRWLTRSEAARLIWAAWRYREVQKGFATGRRSRQHVARFILVALYTGTRAGAVCGAALQPTAGAGWINLDIGVFFRRPQGQRETKKRKPPVRLPNRLLAHLRRWKAAGQLYAVEFAGKPVLDVDKAFRRAVADAGLEVGVSPHTLRHTAATWLMQRGADRWDAAGYLGMTVETLDRVYGHHHPDFQREVAGLITSKLPEQKPNRYSVNKREQTKMAPLEVIDIARA